MCAGNWRRWAQPMSAIDHPASAAPGDAPKPPVIGVRKHRRRQQIVHAISFGAALRAGRWGRRCSPTGSTPCRATLVVLGRRPGATPNIGSAGQPASTADTPPIVLAGLCAAAIVCSWSAHIGSTAGRSTGSSTNRDLARCRTCRSSRLPLYRGAVGTRPRAGLSPTVLALPIVSPVVTA